MAQPLAASSASPERVALLLLAFAALFNCHMFAQSLVFSSEGGALGVGLVNAVRGAVLTVIGGLLFCTPAKPWQCLTRQMVLAAGVITAGGVAWVVAESRAKKAAAPGKAAHADSADKKEL